MPGVLAGYGSSSINDNMPWEYAIELANETGKDILLNTPILASYSYLVSLANLLKYGCNSAGKPYTSATANPAYPPLNPNLNVYFQLADELWNWGYVTTNHECEGMVFSALWDYDNPTANSSPPAGSNDYTGILMSDTAPTAGQAPYGSGSITGSFYTQNVNYDLYAMGQFLTNVGFSIAKTGGSDSWEAPNGTWWWYNGNPAGTGWNSVGDATRMIQISNDSVPSTATRRCPATARWIAACGPWWSGNRASRMVPTGPCSPWSGTTTAAAAAITRRRTR